MPLVFYPGSFDPPTRAHLNLVTRLVRLFPPEKMLDADQPLDVEPRVVVGVGLNPQKVSSSWFTAEERVELLRRSVESAPDLPPNSVECTSYLGLTYVAAKQAGADTLVRGLRNSSDLDPEMSLAAFHRRVAGLDTLYLFSADQFLNLSSSHVKEVWEFGGKEPQHLAPLVPSPVLKALQLLSVWDMRDSERPSFMELETLHEQPKPPA